MKKILSILLMIPTFLLANIAQISALSGEVKIERDTQTIEGYRGFALHEKDIVKTAANARAQIIFSDETVISIGQNAVLDVAKFIYDETDTQNASANIGFMEGAFKTITGNVGKVAPDRFKLKTSSASIGIRGTTIIGNQSQIAVTQGEIEVTAQGVTQILPTGTMTFTAPNTPPTPPTPIENDFIDGIENDLPQNDDFAVEDNFDEFIDDGQQPQPPQQESPIQEPNPTFDDETDNQNAIDELDQNIQELESTPEDFNFPGHGFIFDGGQFQMLDIPTDTVTIKDIQNSGSQYVATAQIDGSDYQTYAFDLNDDIYWGYWEDEVNYAGVELPWLVGYEYTGDLPMNVATYNGSVRGIVKRDNGDVAQILNNANNALSLQIDFGGTAGNVTGTISFDDGFNNQWRGQLLGDTDYANFSGTIADNGSSFPEANVIDHGSFQGSVYGQDDISGVGGSFSIMETDSIFEAVGVFKGN